MNSNLTIAEPRTASQGLLFDLAPDCPVKGEGSRRARSGQIVEDVALSLLGLENIPIDGKADVCFDGKGYGRYVEVKSVKSSSSCPIYNWRHQKEIDSAVNPVYAFVQHACDYAACGTYQEMAVEVSHSITGIYIVPLHFVTKGLEGKKIYKNSGLVAGSRIGYEREGYCEGYRLLPMSHVRNADYIRPITLSTEVYSLAFSCRVYVERGLSKLRRALYQFSNA